MAMRFMRLQRRSESSALHFRILFPVFIGFIFYSIVFTSFTACYGVISYLPVSYLIQGEEVIIPFECTYDKVSSRLTDDIDASGSHIPNGRVYYYSLIASQVYWVIIAVMYAYYFYHLNSRHRLVIYCPSFASVIMIIHHFISVAVWQYNGGCGDTLKGIDFRALREGFQSRGEFQRGQAMLSLVAAIVFDLVWISLVCAFVSNHFSRNLHEEAIQQIRGQSISIPRSRSFSRRNNRVLGMQVVSRSRGRSVDQVQIFRSRSRSSRRRHISGRRQRRRSRSRSRGIRRGTEIVELPNSNSVREISRSS